jgi:DHA2 family multidrug resistance protein
MTFHLTPNISDEAMYLPLALTGFGGGWQVGPISTLINSQTSNVLMGEGMELYLCQRQLGGSWGIAILTILVDRQRSFWSGRLGENVNDYNTFAQDAFRQGAVALQSIGMPHAQAEAGSMGLLHTRLLVQSIVNAFADTFFYQAMIGAVALILVIFFARGHALAAGFRWAVHITR